MLENLNKYTILLASKSPRRRELLEMLKIPFKVITAGGIEETYPATLPVREIPAYLSQLKASAYMERMHGNELVLTADTLVILGDEVLGKPHNHEEAVEMLARLSGKTHHVVTGVTISTLAKRKTFSAISDVRFAHLEKEEIEYYVSNYRPFDKAGGYGIQEWIGGVAVESINGSFYNVMGLPVHRLYRELKNF